MEYLLQNKKAKKPIVALTSYDYCMTSWFKDLDIDIILVGDSLGMVSLGYSNTLPVTMDEMIMHAQSVARFTHPAILVGDMPWMSYQGSKQKTLNNASRFIKEAHMEGVKLEGGKEILSKVKFLVQSGIPVIGHLGLNPQKVLIYGGFKVQGRDEKSKKYILESALALEKAGVYAIVLECIPLDLAKEITHALEIPTIGIGAGPYCDGQILVTQDILGMVQNKKPRFVKQYGEFAELAKQKLTAFIQDVRDHSFPEKNHSYE